MLNKTLFISLLVLSTSAMASGNSQPAPSSSKAHASSDAYSDSYSDSYSESSSVAKGGSAVAKGGSANQSQGQEQAQSVDASGNANVTVDASSNSRRNPVNTAYAAALTSSNDTCMGSSSAGAQGITFGLSFGTTWNDDNCVLRKDARFLHNINRTAPALSLMCSKPSVLKAIQMSGTREDKIACGLEVPQLDEVGVEIPSRNKLYGTGENG